MSADSSSPPAGLKRDLGMFGAMVLGLGSIVGTGVFISIGLAAGLAGPAVILAIALAAAVAMFNGLSSAQLAASHPVSGGTYEYGYKFLSPRLGFTAGWMFMCAKSASAATAALGLSGYLLQLTGAYSDSARMYLAWAVVSILTLVVVVGLKPSKILNAMIVVVTFSAMGYLVIGGALSGAAGGEAFTPFFSPKSETFFDKMHALLHAAALMFVAYTGYGRIATLGEEVHEPRRTIPRAIILTLLVSMVMYLAVAAVALRALGADELALATQKAGAPLEYVAATLALPGGKAVMAVAGVTAMLGVLLNLLLGLSRVLLAMGRRRDVPPALASLNAAGTTPWVAVLATGAIILGLVSIGNLKTTWSFSAFTVLLYYSLTNLAALKLPAEARMFPRAAAVAGLLGCLCLAFFIEPFILLWGLGLLLVGLIWFQVARALESRAQAPVTSSKDATTG